MNGGKACQAFVSRNGACGHTVVFFQDFQQIPRVIGVFFVQQLVGDGFVFQHHGKVDDVGIKGPLVQRGLPKMLHGVVIHALLLQKAGKLLDPGLAMALPKEVQGNKALKPAVFSPVKQLDGTCGKQIVVVLHHAVKHVCRPLVPGAIVIHHQHLGDEKHRPGVVLGALFLTAGAQPAVLALRGHDGIHIFFRSGDHILVFQQIRHGNKAVQPIGNTLPAVGISDGPRAVPHVPPDLIQISAKSLRLDLQLSLQPAFRLQLF